jgi:hypothetical protein
MANCANLPGSLTSISWTIKALHFANTFVQAKLDHNVFAYLPRGYYSILNTQEGDIACLKLRKSLYGLNCAPRLWFIHLERALSELEFKKSSYNKCLLFQPGMILVCFIDDCGLAVDDPAKVDWIVDELHKKGFKLEVVGDFTEFLGVALDKAPAGSIHIHQSGLIDKIIVTSKLQDANPNWTPASPAAVGSDKDGIAYDHAPWQYSSIVGMLVYLTTNTRPYIGYAVSQVARYNNDPKQTHATAVKMIIRYLKRTRDKGMIMRLTGMLDFVCYVDADSAGLFGHEDPRNRNCAISRCGYIILLGGIPVEEVHPHDCSLPQHS